MTDIVEKLRKPAPPMGFEEYDPTFDVRQEAAKEIARLREALSPFARAAEIIAKRPQDYENRIVAIGGLSEPRDLMKSDFERAIAALR